METAYLSNASVQAIVIISNKPITFIPPLETLILNLVQFNFPNYKIKNKNDPQNILHVLHGISEVNCYIL
jgi:hypothetical protein